MKFRPLHDRVLIKVLDSEEKTSGGIIIPDTAKEKPQEKGLENHMYRVSRYGRVLLTAGGSWKGGNIYVCPKLIPKLTRNDALAPASTKWPDGGE